MDKDGYVWNWGFNVGRPTEESRKPMKVEGLDRIIEISIGWNFSMALREDGTIWAWGNNYSGQFGIGNNETPYEPVKAFINLN